MNATNNSTAIPKYILLSLLLLCLKYSKSIKELPISKTTDNPSNQPYKLKLVPISYVSSWTYLKQHYEVI